MTGIYTSQENPFILSQEEKDLILNFRKTCNEGKRLTKAVAEKAVKVYPVAKPRNFLSIVGASSLIEVRHA